MTTKERQRDRRTGRAGRQAGRQRDRQIGRQMMNYTVALNAIFNSGPYKSFPIDSYSSSCGTEEYKGKGVGAAPSPGWI